MSKLSALKKEARRAEDREDFVEAIEYYGRAVSVAREDPAATFEVGLYNRIGDLYLKLDDTSQAVYHYLLAVDHYADDELYPPAIALCRKVLRVAPDQVDAYRKLARLHEATGLTADAREEMDRYLAGVWEAGQVNGALEGLPELVDRLMSGSADLEEVRRLDEEGKPEEAFELLYRQWEDDSADWRNGGGAAERQNGTGEATERVGFPQTDPSDRGGIGASLRRGWQDLFGQDDEVDEVAPPGETDAQETESEAVFTLGEEETGAEAASSDPEAPSEEAREATDAGEKDDGLDEVDDMEWLRAVTTSRGRMEDEEVWAQTSRFEEETEAADDEEEEAAAEAEEPAEEAVEEDGLEVAAAAEPAEEAVEEDGPEVAAAAEPAEEPVEEDRPEVAAEAEEPAEEAVEEPAALPADLLIAAADSLTLETRGRTALPADVAAPGLLPAADPDTPEGRTTAAERPLDRAVRARLLRTNGRRTGGSPPQGPAFQTPGREDYLPAGAEMTGRDPGPALLWLSDGVALLGALDRNEPMAVKPAFGPPTDLLVAAAESLERAVSVEPVAALPSEVAAPALLVDGVAEEPWVAEPVVEATAEERLERRPPEGPAFQTPGRDDYLPAGGEIAARLPGAALSWLADAVELLHRLEWGEPAWLEHAREAKSRAAEALDRMAGDAEPPAALPADLAMPLLLPPARAEATLGSAAANPVVEEVAAAPPEVELTRPAAAAQGARGGRPDPDGPSFQTPGRDDYLPAGAEVGDGLPSPALAWLAASVADIHRLDGGEPGWFEDGSPQISERPEEDPRTRLDVFDPSEEEAAEATKEALALLAAQQAAAPVEPVVEDEEEEADTDAAEAADEEELAADAVPAVEEAPPEEAVAEEAPAEDEPGVGASGAPDVPEPDPAAAGTQTELPETDLSEPEPEPTTPTLEPPAPASGPARAKDPVREPDLTPPVEQPAARPNGLDFTALLRRIGWLRGSDDDGRAKRNGQGGEVARPDGGTSPAGPWSRGPSGSGQKGGSGDGEGGRANDVRPPTVSAPGSGVPDFTDLLHRVGWLREDERS